MSLGSRSPTLYIEWESCVQVPGPFPSAELPGEEPPFLSRILEKDIPQAAPSPRSSSVELYFEEYLNDKVLERDAQETEEPGIEEMVIQSLEQFWDYDQSKHHKEKENQVTKNRVKQQAPWQTKLWWKHETYLKVVWS